MHVLIIKNGALGDVVRTSYFAPELKKKFGHHLRLSWLTSEPAKPLLQFNPYIDDLWTNLDDAKYFQFDVIYSLDDEREIVLQAAMSLEAKKWTGAVWDKKKDVITYTNDAAEWFDMGLLSKFGKKLADKKKKSNLSGHAVIFSKIFDTDVPKPSFFDSTGKLVNKKNSSNKKFVLGINPYAGGRWKSKELPLQELENLIRALLNRNNILKENDNLVLIGAGDDRLKNLEIAKKFSDGRILVPNTDNSILELSSTINSVDLLITSDSLSLHLAIAQGVRFIAFFAPTSAAEIDDYGLGEKIISTASDYCSYTQHVDNSSITSERLLEALDRMIK